MPRFRRAAVLALLVAAAAAAAACRRNSDAAPPCGAVSARFMAIAEQDLAAASIDGPTRRAVQAQLPAMRDSLATACTDSQWTEEVRRCFYAARDHVGLEACQQGLTETQRRVLDRAARGGADRP